MEPDEYDRVTIRVHGLAQQLVPDPEIISRKTMGWWYAEVRHAGRIIVNFRSNTPSKAAEGLCRTLEQWNKMDPESRAKFLETVTAEGT